jgi:hypothetical protein
VSSTPRDPRAFVWDARQAIGHLRTFVHGRTWDDYEGDVLLRSGVERQFEIIGEALNRLSKAAPELAGRIDDLPRSWRSATSSSTATPSWTTESSGTWSPRAWILLDRALASLLPDEAHGG